MIIIMFRLYFKPDWELIYQNQKKVIKPIKKKSQALKNQLKPLT